MQAWAKQKLGYSHEEFGQLSWPEFDKAVEFWMEEEDRITGRFAVHLCQMVNLKVDTKKREPYKPTDFYNFLIDAEQKQDTPLNEEGVYLNPILFDQQIVLERSRAKAELATAKELKETKHKQALEAAKLERAKRDKSAKRKPKGVK